MRSRVTRDAALPLVAQLRPACLPFPFPFSSISKHHLKYPHQFVHPPPSSIEIRFHPILTRTVTRSHKFNDREYQAPESGVIAPQENLPRFFAKSGPTDADPKKTKKDGGGKGNW